MAHQLKPSGPSLQLDTVGWSGFPWDGFLIIDKLCSISAQLWARASLSVWPHTTTTHHLNFHLLFLSSLTFSGNTHYISIHALNHSYNYEQSKVYTLFWARQPYHTSSSVHSFERKYSSTRHDILSTCQFKTRAGNLQVKCLVFIFLMDFGGNTSHPINYIKMKNSPTWYCCDLAGNLGKLKKFHFIAINFPNQNKPFVSCHTDLNLSAQTLGK